MTDQAGEAARDEVLAGIESFDLDGQDEAAVREEIIIPFLKLLGYRRGSALSRISKPLKLPYVRLGREKHVISKQPDYVLDVDRRPSIVVEAKPPTDPVDFASAEQCISYAIHPKVQALLGVVINGCELAVYRAALHPGASDPVLRLLRSEWRSRWRDIEIHLAPGSVRVLHMATATGMLERALPITPSVTVVVTMVHGAVPRVALHSRDGQPLKMEIRTRTAAAAAALASVTDPGGPTEVSIESAEAVVLFGDERTDFNEFYGPDRGPLVLQKRAVPVQADLYLFAPYPATGFRVGGVIERTGDDILVLGSEEQGVRVEMRRQGGTRITCAPERLPLLVGLRCLEFMRAVDEQGELVVIDAASHRVLMAGRGVFSADVNTEFVEVLRKLLYVSLRCRIHGLMTPEVLTREQNVAIDAMYRLLRGEDVEHHTTVAPLADNGEPITPGALLAISRHAVDLLGQQFVLGAARIAVTAVDEVCGDGQVALTGLMSLENTKPPMAFTFPFGRPVTRRPPSASSPRRVMVLGAYPSALHVEWRPPPPYKSIKALAVDDEPTPFWTGGDEAERVERWSKAVGFRPAWGSVRGVGRLNGSSGLWVEREVLQPLGVTRDEAWITDALDTYRASTGGGKRLLDTYEPFALAVGLPSAMLPAHPDEGAIVAEALADHLSRLRAELRTAAPELVVTLGNAALRVLRRLVEVEGAPTRLHVEGYGVHLSCRFEGRAFEWLPLAHPAAPKVYRAAHARWKALARRRGVGAARSR